MSGSIEEKYVAWRNRYVESCGDILSSKFNALTASYQVPSYLCRWLLHLLQGTKRSAARNDLQ